MEILKIAEVGIEVAVQRAAAVLKAGGVILYPTDTLYGLGADALSDEAVARVRAIKGRDEGKPIHALVADLAMAEQYANAGDMVRHLAHELPKGKVSFVTRKREGVNTGIAAGISTFGFRIPDHGFCQTLLGAVGGPITATSANPAGIEPERSVPQILAQLGPVIAQIDLIIDGGEAPSALPSTIVDFSDGPHPIILREGAVLADDVWEVLRGADAAHG